MVRPIRNWLLAALAAALLLLVLPALPSAVGWTLAGLLLPVLGLAVFVTAPLRRARRHFARGAWDDAALAVAAFERSLETPWRREVARLAVGSWTSNPHAAARNLLGAVRIEQGRLDDAATHLDRAIALDPHYAIAWANRALLEKKRGDLPALERARAEALRLGAGRARLLAALG